ncbi:MAG: radical SAM protein, partial [Candidatus Omnitrophota bacterium]
MEMAVSPGGIAVSKNSPAVSIIVVNHNGRKLLTPCFDSLYNLNYCPADVEIILVDNCSRDGSVEYVRQAYPGVKIIENDINNYCRANNLGARHSSGKYIALLNNDTQVDKNWLVELLTVIKREGSIGAVGSKILFMDGRLQSVGHQEYPGLYWVDQGFGEEDRGQYDTIREVASICGCSVLYRRSCLEEVGLLDEDFNMYLEDVDMSIRCRAKGWSLFIAPSSIIYHQLHGTSGDEDSARLAQEKNRLLLIAKHWPEKLAQSLAGREYFIKNLDYNKEKDICGIMAVVCGKLFRCHSRDVVERVLPELISSLSIIFNAERHFFIQSLSAEQQKFLELSREKEALTAELEEDEKKNREFQETTNLLRQELGQNKEALATLQRRLDEQGHINETQRGQIARMQMEMWKKDGQIETLNQQTRSAQKQINQLCLDIGKKDSSIEGLTQQEEKTQALCAVYQKEISEINRQVSRQEAQIGALKKNLEQTYKERDKKNEETEILRGQFSQVQAELQGVYGSTAFRYLVKPLWKFLWPVKQWIKKVLKAGGAGKFCLAGLSVKGQNRLLTVFRESRQALFVLGCLAERLTGQLKYFKQDLKIKGEFFLSAKNRAWRKMYFNHIRSNTFPPYPARLILMLTSRCNMSCLFCDIGRRDYQKKELSREEACKIIDSAYRLGVESLEITGGEPLLHPGLWEIVEYAASRNMRVGLSTNGFLVKEQLSQIKKNNLNYISISIDGKEATHDALRNLPGAYKKAREAIDLLKQARINVAVNFVITNRNINEINEVNEYFSRQGIHVSFFPVINQPDLYIRQDREKKIYTEFIKKLAKERKISSAWRQYYLKIPDYFEGKSPKVRCLGLVDDFGIDVEGNVLPCCVWDNKDASLGNVFRSDLEIIWSSGAFQQKRQGIFTNGCPGCYNPSICEFSKMTGLNYFLGHNGFQGKNFAVRIGGKEKTPLPQLVHMKFTNRCNLKCRMCDIWKEEAKAELSTFQWKEIITRVYNWLGPFNLVIAGGEPLLRPDLEELIHFCSQKGIVTSITTNGTLIDEARAKKLVEAKLDTFNISLDSLTPDVHNYLRGTGRYQKTIQGIEEIKKYRGPNPKPYICISSIIMRPNLDEIGKMAEGIRLSGNDAIIFQPLDNNFHSKYRP